MSVVFSKSKSSDDACMWAMCALVFSLLNWPVQIVLFGVLTFSGKMGLRGLLVLGPISAGTFSLAAFFRSWQYARRANRCWQSFCCRFPGSDVPSTWNTTYDKSFLALATRSKLPSGRQQQAAELHTRAPIQSILLSCQEFPIPDCVALAMKKWADFLPLSERTETWPLSV